MKLLCKKSLRHSPFDEIVAGEFYELKFEGSTILIKGKGMNSPSWLEVNPQFERGDTNYLNYFYSLEETREIELNKLLK